MISFSFVLAFAIVVFRCNSTSLGFVRIPVGSSQRSTTSMSPWLGRHMLTVGSGGDEASSVGTDSAKRQPVPLNEDAYEIDRLAQDAQAMDAMKAEADMEFAKGLRTPWKWKLRKRIWDP
jgi:hypothetical protein